MIQSCKLISLVLAVAVLAVSSDLFAGSGRRRGTSGASELIIPVGSRGTALNGAFTSGISGIEAIHWNPAGLAVSEHAAQAIFSHQDYLADMTVNYGAVAAKFGNVGTFGLSIKSFGFGTDMVETTVENPNGTGRTFSPTFLTVGLTYSRQMTDRITFGTTLKVVSEEIISAQATGYAFDFGLQYSTGLGGLQLGIVLKNFGPNMRFDGPELEHKIQIPGSESGTRQENLRIRAASFELPSQLELGVSYSLSMGEQSSLIIMGTFQNNSFSFDSYNVGVEYAFNDWVFVRGSYSLVQREGLEEKSDGFTSASEDYLFGPALGAGVKLELSASVVMNLDYAYRTVSIFDGGTQWFTITFGL
ncbi:MAG: PorV/PorQ family protein [bacterium]